MKFQVNDNETITECIQRMRSDGYIPIRRIEKPIFQKLADGSIEVLKQEIIFIGKKLNTD
ncbi:NETI motif-containing protein [Staphylococcus lugdunensis]|uniref:NETI motif-containing protein n=1 Tax=Staphylococcus TaxID=1279 RepID=UPI0008A5C3C2|nr:MULTISPECIES: NETI motif-containing protein [Staphylococcus]ARJ13625.1 NETI motif-containing protein [Staphylococcus lugdunensis]MCH8666847.1 NETI motif-containing protein [Staphylococcus lugdunensis]OFJ63710.1 hypothetical protein HMPREF2855_08505 [Staphylococcus sp. HMSC077E11]OFM42022.1 hypothetical protein HMPREF2688_00895 [Staphylococcus sp. HMSC077E12]OFR86196.1 hypothetical protein HMPREF2864_04175 [Staphylococcus sp. HMSC059F04]